LKFIASGPAEGSFTFGCKSTLLLAVKDGLFAALQSVAMSGMGFGTSLVGALTKVSGDHFRPML